MDKNKLVVIGLQGSVVIILFIVLNVFYYYLHYSLSNNDIVFIVRNSSHFPSILNNSDLDEENSIQFVENHTNPHQITKIIHQSWKNIKNIPKYFLRHVPSWKKCFPDWEYKFWTDQDNRDLIVKHYSWFLRKYDSFPLEIYRADCARYFYMFHYGGIYTDMDNECLRPFEHLLANYTIVFGDINYVRRITKLKIENYIQNSFMYSKPNHPFWLELVLEILNSYTDSTADNVTGPLVLSNLIQKYQDRYPYSHEIKIYEGRYFNPITWGNTHRNFWGCKTRNKMSEKYYLACRKYHYNRGSYVVQYHSHTWG